ncbi:hypothetical protein D9C73_001596 [Collichthys lucidus]|uniref:Uncharacterized protein n=1 Tax=Collichthys lucidus TaxID=240159 RepID=A0A4U5U187_COLLU|nr:hypothetical protein D9C73_001596 [Collichthys lucidus]
MHERSSMSTHIRDRKTKANICLMRWKPFFPPTTLNFIGTTGEGLWRYTRRNERSSIAMINSFTYLISSGSDVCHVFLQQIPLSECAAAAAAEARLCRTDRGSSLRRAWPLWLAAAPERGEAAWSLTPASYSARDTNPFQLCLARVRGKPGLMDTCSRTAITNLVYTLQLYSCLGHASQCAAAVKERPNKYRKRDIYETPSPQDNRLTSDMRTDGRYNIVSGGWLTEETWRYEIILCRAMCSPDRDREGVTLRSNLRPTLQAALPALGDMYAHSVPLLHCISPGP